MAERRKSAECGESIPWSSAHQWKVYSADHQGPQCNHGYTTVPDNRTGTQPGRFTYRIFHQPGLQSAYSLWRTRQLEDLPGGGQRSRTLSQLSLCAWPEYWRVYADAQWCANFNLAV